MELALADLIRVAGAGQLSILIASSLVPFKLQFKRDLASLPPLHRQLYWTYGGYVVMGIITLGLISLTCADELAAGSRLARAPCASTARCFLGHPVVPPGDPRREAAPHRVVAHRRVPHAHGAVPVLHRRLRLRGAAVKWRAGSVSDGLPLSSLTLPARQEHLYALTPGLVYEEYSVLLVLGHRFGVGHGHEVAAGVVRARRELRVEQVGLPLLVRLARRVR